LGDGRDEQGDPLTELFLVDVPDNVTQSGDVPLEGTETRRPSPPAGARQRRLSYTTHRRFPGIQGPRHWPRSSPDGSRIAFLMRDDAGVVQLWTISPNGGSPKPLTADSWEIDSAFTWNSAGTHLAAIADGSVMIIDADNGKSRWLTEKSAENERPRPEACVFSPDGRRIAFVRQVGQSNGVFNQVFVVDVEG
jgi:Tol biopolymer transport system component